MSVSIQGLKEQNDFAACRLYKEGVKMGFPVLVKAALGGGGKGMKLATKEEELQVKSISKLVKQ